MRTVKLGGGDGSAISGRYHVLTKVRTEPHGHTHGMQRSFTLALGGAEATSAQTYRSEIQQKQPTNLKLSDPLHPCLTSTWDHYWKQRWAPDLPRPFRYSAHCSKLTDIRSWRHWSQPARLEEPQSKQRRFAFHPGSSLYQSQGATNLSIG